MEMVTINHSYLAVYLFRLLRKDNGRAKNILLQIFYKKVMALGGTVGEFHVQSQWEKFGIINNDGRLPYQSRPCILPRNKILELIEWFLTLNLKPLPGSLFNKNI